MNRTKFLKTLGLGVVAAVVAPFVPKKKDNVLWFQTPSKEWKPFVTNGFSVSRKTYRVSSREPTTVTIEFKP